MWIWILLIVLVACIFLWFWKVHSIMTERKNVVNIAINQRDHWRKQVLENEKDADAVAVLARCEDIVRQAVVIYNRFLKKPYIFLPARLMGYRLIP